MLAALGRGNDARQWHTLIDKVFSPKTLALAFASVTSIGSVPKIKHKSIGSVPTNKHSEKTIRRRGRRVAGTYGQ
jgi:hypothetical protein